MNKPTMPLTIGLTLAATLLGGSVPVLAADEAVTAPVAPPAVSAPEMPGPPMPGAMGRMPWEGPMGGPGHMGPGPMRGGRMGPMNREMMQQHRAEMQAQLKAMEGRLANIEALLRELVDLQKAGR